MARRVSDPPTSPKNFFFFALGVYLIRSRRTSPPPREKRDIENCSGMWVRERDLLLQYPNFHPEARIDATIKSHTKPALAENYLFETSDIMQKSLRRVFFELPALRGQKYHNNLLPLVRVGLNLVGFARGYDIDGRFDRFHS